MDIRHINVIVLHIFNLNAPSVILLHSFDANAFPFNQNVDKAANQRW